MRPLLGRLSKEIGSEEIALLVAIVLLAAGFWQTWKPGVYFGPASVLLWMFLPTRVRFVAREPEPTRKQ